jgi:hypothetical protein
VPPFAPPGPWDWFPDFIAPTAALRLLRAPWSLGFSLRFQVPVLSGDAQISQVPRQPLYTCAVLRPRWGACRSETPGLRPCVEPALCCLPCLFSTSASTWDKCLGAQWRRPHTRCLRFAAALASGPRKTRFRLAVSYLARSGLSPAGHIESFSLLHRDPLSPGLSWRKNAKTSRMHGAKAATI